jgi:hypothetical protein
MFVCYEKMGDERDSSGASTENYRLGDSGYREVKCGNSPVTAVLQAYARVVVPVSPDGLTPVIICATQRSRETSASPIRLEL